MEPKDTPPYEPVDAEPTTRPTPNGSAARATPAGGSSDRTKKIVAVAAVASFFTAMVGMAAARSGDSGASTTPAGTSVGSADGGEGAQLGVPDGRQPLGGAQPAPPAFGRGSTSSHGS
jgi:hypothetical protein